MYHTWIQIHRRFLTCYKQISYSGPKRWTYTYKKVNVLPTVLWEPDVKNVFIRSYRYDRCSFIFFFYRCDVHFLTNVLSLIVKTNPQHKAIVQQLQRLFWKSFFHRRVQQICICLKKSKSMNIINVTKEIFWYVFIKLKKLHLSVPSPIDVEQSLYSTHISFLRRFCNGICYSVWYFQMLSFLHVVSTT